MLAAIRRSGAAWTRALLLQLLLAGPGGCLSRQELFPFGPGHGDLELEAGDDQVSPALELRRALRFFDKSDINSVYVSATRGRRWGPSGRRAWGPSRGRKEGRGWQGRPRGRTDVGVVGGDRDPLAAGARGAALGLLASRPRRARRRLRAAWPLSPEEHAGLGGSSRLRGPARALPTPGPRDPGRSFLSGGCGRHRRREVGPRLAIVLFPWGRDPVRRDSGKGESWVAGGARAWVFRRCRVRKRPPNPASAPGI